MGSCHVSRDSPRKPDISQLPSVIMTGCQIIGTHLASDVLVGGCQVSTDTPHNFTSEEFTCIRVSTDSPHTQGIGRLPSV